MQNSPNQPGSPITGGPEDPSSIGIDAKLAAALSYIGIVGLIFFFIEKENRFVRFHALQSIFLALGWIILLIALLIVNVILVIVVTAISATAGSVGGLLGVIVSLISVVVWLVLPLAFLGLLIFCAFKAYQGNIISMPIVGKLANNIVNK
jgi:uncharacterized membrane protein